MTSIATVRQVTTPGSATASPSDWGLLSGIRKAVFGKPKGPYVDADTQLIEQCLSGHESAWEDLVKIHTRRVYAICYRFTGSDHSAQDLTQEVFLRVFRSLGGYRSGEGSFTVWLGRLTRNLLIDNYRRNKRDRQTDSIEDQLPVLEEKTTSSSRADSMLAGREASEMLQAGLQKLSPELREAVILRDLEELEYKEIANVLSVPEGTVKSRINRGRAELARVLRLRGVTP
jgi:RNA polymerase sigma-70 factor (ECF subfamily)